MKTLTEILFGKRTQNTHDADTTRQIVVPETTPVQETLQESTVMSEDTIVYPAIYQFMTKQVDFSDGVKAQKKIIDSIITGLGENVVINYDTVVEDVKGSYGKDYAIRGTVKLDSTTHAKVLKELIENGFKLENSVITKQNIEDSTIVTKIAKERDDALSSLAKVKEEATTKYDKLLSEHQATAKYFAGKGARETELAVIPYQNLIDAISAAPKAIYQFETAPMTVEEANARVANINCILGTYTANIASKNFAAYATRKTQVQMKDLLDKKNLLVEPEQFIAGVITIDGVPYAEQVKDTIEAIIPMAKSALTYQGKKLDEKVADK
jgi:hypothetical protein